MYILAIAAESYPNRSDLLFKPSSGLDVLNSDYLNMAKDRFRALIDFVFQSPHDHLMLELNSNRMYRNFNRLIL